MVGLCRDWEGHSWTGLLYFTQFHFICQPFYADEACVKASTGFYSFLRINYSLPGLPERRGPKLNSLWAQMKLVHIKVVCYAGKMIFHHCSVVQMVPKCSWFGYCFLMFCQSTRPVGSHGKHVWSGTRVMETVWSSSCCCFYRKRITLSAQTWQWRPNWTKNHPNKRSQFENTTLHHLLPKQNVISLFQDVGIFPSLCYWSV